jgi:hypothetical protein
MVARIIAHNLKNTSNLLGFAGTSLFYGGDPGELPIARREDVFLDRKAIAGWKDAPDEVILCMDKGGIRYFPKKNSGRKLARRMKPSRIGE